VARLHLQKSGCTLTTPTMELPAYIDVPVYAPYTAENYRFLSLYC
jgi:hypothetical protein